IKSDGSFIGLSHNISGGDISASSDIYETTYVHSEKATLFKSGGLAPHINVNKIGEIKSYGEYGVEGELCKNTFDDKKALELDKPKEGTAYIYCKTPVSNKMKMHEIEITKVYKNTSRIKVKDEDLKKYRGGIVGGMSGSPVIQDGKIVGGVRSSIIFNHKIGYISNIQSMLSYEEEE
ncbi:MAG: SpoIVB peptidase S55 domain-containing protein, partial [Paraclostridium sp.]